MNPGLSNLNPASKSPTLNNTTISTTTSPTFARPTTNHHILPNSSPRISTPSESSPPHQQPPTLTSGKGKFAVRPFTPITRVNSAELPDAATDGSAPPKRIACVECRQQKVRCNAHEKYPEPCSRCTKKNLKCVLQADFKRTYKRRRLVEVEKEIERLRSSIESQESEKRRIVSGSLLDLSNSSYNYSIPLTEKPNSTLSYHDLPPPGVSKEKAQVADTPSSVDSTHHEHFHTPPGGGSSSSAHYHHHRPGEATLSGHVDLDPAALVCTEKTMDGVTLTPDTIANLYKEFVAKYHPFLPVVDVSRGPEQIYALCPSLFWTIMAIASRRYDKDGELMMELTPILKTCLSEITISPINRFVSKSETGPILNVVSAYTVQAFLIYTMWPSITSTLSADSSWNTAGIAMFSAIRVGLHCPGYARDFGRIKADNPIYPKISEQIRTWIGCNIVSQTVATVYGFPAFTSFDASVLSACEASSGIDVPEAIKQLMLIQHLEEEVAKTLNSNPKDPLGLSELSERLSLIQILSRKLDELEMRLGEIDDCRKFVMLGARVHLLTYYFLDNGGYSELQLQKGMVHAYNSALALLEHSERAYRRDRSFFRYMPNIYAQILWQSSCIICKVYHSPFAQFVDSNTGRQMYMSCVSLISKASILKHDVMYRAAEIMQQVWRLYGALARRNGGFASPRILIRTRMSASVFFDALWTLREEIGIRSIAPVVLDQRNPVDADDDDDIETGVHSNEGTPAASSEMLGVTLGPAQPYRFNTDDDNQLSEADLHVHTTLRTLPYDPKPITLGPTKPAAKSTRGSTRGRGRGRGGRRKQETNARTAASAPIASLPVVENSQPGAAVVPSTNLGMQDTLLSNTVGLQSKSSTQSPLLTNLSEDLGSTPATQTPPPASTVAFDQHQQQAQQAQQTPSESVINGIDFFSWEADVIWRDVDTLMSDFGFRVEEAPTFDFLSAGPTVPSGNGSVAGSGSATPMNLPDNNGGAAKRY